MRVIRQFEAMPIAPAARDVLVRLGAYRSEDASMFKRATRELSSLRPSGRYVCVPVRLEQDAVYLADRRVESRSLARYLAGCEAALVLAATLGPRVCKAIAQAFEQGRAEDAVWMDAAASVAVDAGLDFMLQQARVQLRKETGVLQSTRYSPGYGDCPITAQGDLFALVQAQQLGLSLSEGMMLMPEKSVLAVCGVQYAKEQR